jgi:CubicO group peptidase (beta-lactamase class C family)
MKPHFPPGTAGKAKYGDTNHQILSLIIEHITGVPVKRVLNTLFEELSLTNTYVCDEIHPEQFVPMRYKAQEIHLPLFLNSTGNDIISTAKDQMTFLKAFFNGYFSPKNDCTNWSSGLPFSFPFTMGSASKNSLCPASFRRFITSPR